MGRHTASRASLTAALASAARRGAHGAARVAPRRRTLGTGAAVAAVALTASTAAAAFGSGTAPSAAGTGTTTDGASASGATAASATPASTTIGTVAADPETVEAAGDALQRAQFLTGEGAAGLTPEQVAQIEDARTRLSEAVTEVSSADQTPHLSSLPAVSVGTQPADPDTVPSATPDATDDDGADTLAESVPALDERGGERASRTSARTPLGELAAAAPALDAALPDLAAASDEPTASLSAESAADPDDAAPDASASAETATESPEEDAAAADTATASPDLATGSSDDAAAPPATDVSSSDAPTSEEIASLTAELSTLLDAAGSGVTVEVVPGPPSAAEIAAQLDTWAASTADYGNGQIPASALCELSFAPGEQLRCDAAHQIEALNEKFREAFGVNLSVTDSYRSYASQVAVKASRGYFAAPPGMSNHGWALALDLGGGIQGYGTAQYEWMRANAPAYGWDNPEWARAGGSKNEPWHWEYGDLS
ncbi:D-alanyl-D-alanine carboxypeptidase family protein [Cellulosimicrobium cellulans]|uniref:M15 family metallopeptidase n=1 Tax=Cellulosimicrobium cellulans TaxID=1710 RepID=UPI001ED9D63F|nr:M15 family metallopeptidase [Cellulosimicrobium cellulans]UKJ63661.1 D-alanyl-D-alanine carboxypeptidase family protein [Cellulosimicrobium cellulans]